MCLQFKRLADFSYYTVLFVFLLSSSVFANPGSLAEHTHEFTLKNGLKLVVRENHRAPVAVFQIWYKVGSVDEPLGQTGLSHIVEHMMFKGTKTLEPGEFSRKIAEHGGEENAFTSRDYTGYFQIMNAENIELSFQLEADRMRNLVVDEKEFKREIEVIKEERRSRVDDQPKALTFERFNAQAHISTGYHHPIIGWPQDIKQMTLADTMKWYQTWYAPNNAVIVIVGDVKAKAMHQLAQKYFGAYPARPLPQRKQQQSIEPLGLKEVTVNVPAQLPIVYIGYQTPVLNTATNPDDPFVLEVVAALLGGLNSSRLNVTLIREKELASVTYASYDYQGRFDDTFLITAMPNKNITVEALENAIFKEVDNLKHHLVSEKELQRIKHQVLAQYIYAQDSLFHQARVIGSHEAIGLPWQTSESYLDAIQNVTKEDILRVANQYLQDDRLTIARLNPTQPDSNQKAP